MILDDVLAGHAACLKIVQVLHQVADREVGRVALTAVTKLAAVLQSLVGWHVHRRHFVANAVECGLDKMIVGHGETTDEDRRVLALLAGETAWDFVAPLGFGFGFEAKTGALGGFKLSELCVQVCF